MTGVVQRFKLRLVAILGKKQGATYEITPEEIQAHFALMKAPRDLDRELNHLVHIQMHLSSNGVDIEAKAQELLEAGATIDDETVLHHIGGGSIWAGAPLAPIQERMLRFFHDRGVSLDPLCQLAVQCRNNEALMGLQMIEQGGELQALTVPTTAPSTQRRL